MSVSEELLEKYLFDFDNSKIGSDGDTETLDKILRSDLVVSADHWSKLIDINFDEDRAKEFFSSCDEVERELYFTFGIVCCLNFVQSNFTGPKLSREVEEFLESDLFSNVSYDKLLCVNNEDVNPNTKFPVLLVAAKTIFTCCPFNSVLNIWWSWRSTMIHQQILDELSPTLLSNVDRLHKEIQNISLEGHMKAKLELEQAQLYLVYRNISKAETHIETAGNILGVKCELIGKLGRRTKYQENDIAQLSLKLTLTEKDGIKRPLVRDFDVPKNLVFRDNVRLETISFVEKSEDCLIPNTEQKLIIVIMQEMITAKPHDELFYEQLEPFLDLILKQKNTWAVRVVGLLLKCRVEAKNNRTLEHYLSQCEEIVTHLIKNEKPHPLIRVGGVWGTGLQPIWKTQRQYADIMLNLGLVKASLVFYIRLQLWDMVIACYTILNMKHKAAEIIKQQLDIKPTVNLWCLLGVATDDVSCFATAWEMSKKRSHRAQRHWGMYYFNRKEYQQCIPHFEKSLSINPLQAFVWSRLGFAALETENWQVAATAYRRYTTLEPDGFEAWNNLAQAYLKLGNKLSAQQALYDALRCNYENWKVWENLLVVSVDIGNLPDIIRAYHRLLDLKEKYLNHIALNTLVLAFTTTNESGGKISQSLLQKVRELLGRITALYPGDGYIWELYASIAPSLTLNAQRLQKAHRGYTQNGNWDKDPDLCQHVLFICHKLGRVVLEKSIDPKDTLLNSARLILTSTLAVAKKYDYEITRDLIKEVAADLEAILEKTKTNSSK